MHDVSLGASGILATFGEARIISVADHQLAVTMSRRHNPPDEVMLAFALATRELRQGSVFVSLREAHLLPPLSEVDDGREVEAIELPWPEPSAWVEAVAASPLVGTDRVFVLDDDRLYLARFWATEQRVRQALMERKKLPVVEAEEPGELPPDIEHDALQDKAVKAALSHLTSVITGGPGTGKTTTVVRILNALGAHSPVSVALAAPTGRAARQLQESVEKQLNAKAVSRLEASTLHKLLGLRVRAVQGRFHAGNPLPFNIVVVDETSMVSLEHMAALLDAISPATRLILVGDPHQLRSVEAGAVLADIVQNSSLTQPGAVVKLGKNRRSNEDINRLAEAIDSGDVERALAAIEQAQCIEFLDYDGTHPERLTPLRHDVLAQANALLPAAHEGRAKEALSALGEHRILCAHRVGAYGVQEWARAAQSIIADAHGGYGQSAPYVGQPVLITRNSDMFSNGDVGCFVRTDAGIQAAIDQGTPKLVAPALLDDAADLHAMTIHKSQGGQYRNVSVVLPPVTSPLATRELLYTAVTRAKEGLKLYGSRDAFAKAVTTPVRRASGLSR